MTHPRAFAPLAVLVVVLLANPLRAQSPDDSRAAPGPKPPAPRAAPVGDTAAQGRFGAQLWLVGERRFFADWARGSRETPVTTTQAGRGMPLFVVVTFGGPAQSTRGLAHVTYTLTVRRPDGSVLTHRPDALGCRGWTPPSTLALLLGRDALAVVPAATDPPGTYRVEARVLDRVAGIELPLAAAFTVR